MLKCKKQWVLHRKGAIGTRASILIPMAANDRGSLDFVSDQPTDDAGAVTQTCLDINPLSIRGDVARIDCFGTKPIESDCQHEMQTIDPRDLALPPRSASAQSQLHKASHPFAEKRI
jgi:hypothetical protein